MCRSQSGCCLAYKRPDTDHDDEDVDDDIVEFRRRFPSNPGEPQYCGTCSFRERDEAEARQLFWFELARRRLAASTDDPHG